MIVILIMNAFLALLFVLDKELLNFLPPMIFLSSRTLVCGTLFGIYFLTTHWGKIKATWNDLFVAIVLSFFNIYLANVLFFASLHELSSAKASLIYNSKPFIVAILAYIFLKDSFSWGKLIGLIIGWLGFIPLLFFDKSEVVGYTISWAEIYALGTAVSVAISYLLYHRLMTKRQVSVSFTSTINLFAAGVLSLINVYFFELNPTTLATITINAYSIFLFIAVVVVTMVWAMSFTYLTGIYPSAFLAATSFTVPLFAAFFEWVLFGRMVSYHFFMTLTCVAIGLVFIYRAEKHKLGGVKLQEMEID